MIVRWITVIALFGLLVGCGAPPTGEDINNPALGARAQRLLENEFADLERAVNASDVPAARTALDAFRTAFQDIEADVEGVAPQADEAISTALTNLETALNAGTPDMAAANQALGTLRQALESLAAGTAPRP